MSAPADAGMLSASEIKTVYRLSATAKNRRPEEEKPTKLWVSCDKY